MVTNRLIAMLGLLICLAFVTNCRYGRTSLDSANLVSELAGALLN